MDSTAQKSFSPPAPSFAGVVASVFEDRLRSRVWWREVSKRGVDLVLVVLVGGLALPLIAVIAAMIKLSDFGPVFYADERIGREGRRIFIYKFRTMVRDADAALARCLREDPQRRREWREHQKLRDDPRVTRLGRVLRCLSLDELPQVWNVLRGEMSFVGPRPILVEEAGRYGRVYDLYTRVKPGITGLWQVSGRNETPYRHRVFLAAYYVRNWTFLLDLYIVARTPAAVLGRRGAY